MSKHTNCKIEQGGFFGCHAINLPNLALREKYPSCWNVAVILVVI